MTQKFELGQVVVTCGVFGWVGDDPVRYSAMINCLAHHQAGFWGPVDPEGVSLVYAKNRGGRLMSVYIVHDNTIWIITEADRSATTVLFPSEY